jgi:hypothetical protein
MADEHAPKRGPADLRELCIRMTQHPNPDVIAVAGVLYGNTVARGVAWWRAPLAQIQHESNLSLRRTRTALTIIIEDEAWFWRRHNLGRPAEGEEAGDEYAPAPLAREVNDIAREVAEEVIWAAWKEQQATQEDNAPPRARTRGWPGELGNSPGH